jgi:hypothetical protein
MDIAVKNILQPLPFPSPLTLVVWKAYRLYAPLPVLLCGAGEEPVPALSLSSRDCCMSKLRLASAISFWLLALGLLHPLRNLTHPQIHQQGRSTHTA